MFVMFASSEIIMMVVYEVLSELLFNNLNLRMATGSKKLILIMILIQSILI